VAASWRDDTPELGMGAEPRAARSGRRSTEPPRDVGALQAHALAHVPDPAPGSAPRAVGATTALASRPSGLSLGPASTRATKP
jgi:hypothetical protein